jgi:hypothetical protein
MRAIRVFLWLVLALGIVWGGYWFVGARAVEQGARDWFAEQKAHGMVAENAGIAVAGFADRFDLTVSEVHLADPVSGWGWQAPFAQVFAMTWKPWHLIAALPHDQVISAPDGQKVTIGSTRLMASLLLTPTPALPLHRAVIEGEGLKLTSDAGWTMAADKTVLAAESLPTPANTLRLGGDLTQVTLPASLSSVADLGPVLASLHLDANVTLSQPIDRNLNGAEVQGITLTLAHVVWGPLELSAQGQLTPDAYGLAEGKIDLDLKGWRSLPAVLVALDLVPAENEVTVLRVLEFLAKTGPNPEVVHLPVTFKSGAMALGPVKVGPAPRLN